jgi:hypothetical protein
MHVLTSRWRSNLIPGHLLKFWEEDSENEACRILEIQPRPQNYAFLEPIVGEPLSLLPDDDIPGESDWNASATSPEDILMQDFLDDTGELDEGGLTSEADKSDKHPEATSPSGPTDISSGKSDPDIVCEASGPSSSRKSPLDHTLQQLRLPLPSLNHTPMVCQALRYNPKRSNMPAVDSRDHRRPPPSSASI